MSVIIYLKNTFPTKVHMNNSTEYFLCIITLNIYFEFLCHIFTLTVSDIVLVISLWNILAVYSYRIFM